MLRTLLVLAAGVRLASAVVNWQAPFLGVPPNGHRSPCPALNTLANHGIIPNDGLHLTFKNLFSPISEMMGKDNTTTKILLGDMLSRFGTPDSNGILSFNLSSLDVHASGSDMSFAAEHDASLTRLDAYWGDAVVVRPDKVNSLLSLSNDGKTLTMANLAQALKNARIASFASNPTFLSNFDLGAASDSFTNAALLLVVLGANASRVPTIGVDAAKSFLLEERIPSGWYPSQAPVTTDWVQDVSADHKRRREIEQNMADSPLESAFESMQSWILVSILGVILGLVAGWIDI
ncbi:hypothetical protein HDU98_001739, partial [Podochytrium sp. JEL0797]